LQLGQFFGGENIEITAPQDWQSNRSGVAKHSKNPINFLINMINLQI